MRRAHLYCVALLLLAGCAFDRLPRIPMDTISDSAPGAPAGRTLVVMLPGAYDVPQDFLRHGFVRALRERGLPVDVVAADSHAGYFTSQTLVERLREDVIAPARARGYRAVWLAGISLGGYGSLLYAREHGRDVDGIILLAPYLGSRGLVAQIERAGGLAAWQPEPFPAYDYERALLVWLKQYEAGPGRPPIYLGYGADDRFAAAHRLLAARLPRERVWVLAGGHDWATWSALWAAILDAGVLSGAAPA